MSIAEVQLACRLFFVDLEGLNDGRAVKTIIPQVNPRKMVKHCSLGGCSILNKSQILVHAPQAATDELIESCANIRTMTKEIYAPTRGETIQIGQHTNSYSISLSDELLASIKMSRVSYTFGATPSQPTDRLCDRSSKITRWATFLAAFPTSPRPPSPCSSPDRMRRQCLRHSVNPRGGACLARAQRRPCRSRQ